MDVIASHRRADWGAIGSLVLSRRLYPNAVIALPEGLAEQPKRAYGDVLRAALLLRTPAEVNMAEISRLILIDASRRAQIGVWADVAERPNVEVHIYNRHPASEDDVPGDLEVRRGVGSCVTLLVELLKEKSLALSPTDATWALIGLLDDTGGLSFVTTTPDDLRAAAWLLDHGANTEIIAETRRGGWTPEQVLVLRDLLQSSAPRRLFGLDLWWSEIAAPLATPGLDKLVEQFHHLRGARATIALLAGTDDVQLIGISEVDKLNMAQLARLFGGEGSPQLAQILVRGMTIAQARDKIFQYLREILPPVLTAANLMRPSFCVNGDQNVKDAALMLLRNRLEAAPIVDAELHLLGVINRFTLNLAVEHQLGDWKVTELVDREPASCAPVTDVSALCRLFDRSRQRLVPVVEDDRLRGVVSSEAAYRAIVETKAEDTEVSSASEWQTGQLMTDSLARLLPPDLLRLLQRLGRLAAKDGMRACLVGGCVRDLVLNRPNLDLDVVIEGDAIGLARELAAEFSAGLTVHKEFQTARLDLGENHIDFAAARHEYYSHPGALPVVSAATIEDDAARRDFTMNTLLLHLDPEKFGAVVDLHGGREDLRDGSLRVLHALSFVEDPTRIFRAVRFEKRFGFRLDRQTLSLLQTAVAHGFVDLVSGSRIWKELRLIFREAEAAEMIERLIDLGVFFSLRRDSDFSRLLRRTSRVTSAVVRQFPEQRFDTSVIWMAVVISAITDVAAARKMVARLDLPRNSAGAILSAPDAAYQMIRRLTEQTIPKLSVMAGILRAETNEVRLLSLILSSRDDMRRLVHRYWSEWEKIEPLLDGHALKKLGLPAGPLYAEILAAILDARLDGEVTTKDDELALAKHLWRERK